MKKIILAAAVAFAVVSAHAQATREVGARGTLGLGIGSQMTGGGYIDLFKSIELGGALYANIPLKGSETIGIQPEINFFRNQIGRQQNTSAGSSSWRAEYTSIDIPVLFTYSIPLPKFTLIPEVGPYISIPFGKVKFKGDRDVDADIETNFLFGFTLGTAFAIPLQSGGKAVIDARYINDLTSLGAKDVGAVSTRGSLNLSIGYQMKL